MLNPIRFNNLEIIYPLSWVVNPTKNKNTFTTEAGTEIDVIKRDSRLSISASFKCTSDWLATFSLFRDMDAFALTWYDPTTQTYDVYRVRMDNFKYTLVPKSQDLEVTKGIWEVSFNLEEF